MPSKSLRPDSRPITQNQFLGPLFLFSFQRSSARIITQPEPAFLPYHERLVKPFSTAPETFSQTQDPRLTPGPSPRSSRAALIPHPSNTCQKISGQKITALLHPHNLIAKIKQNHNQMANSTLKDEPEKRATSGVLPPVAGGPMDRGIAPEPAPPPRHTGWLRQGRVLPAGRPLLCRRSCAA